jgi:hypothetical protein
MIDALLWSLWGSGVPLILVGTLLGWYVWPPKEGQDDENRNR